MMTNFKDRKTLLIAYHFPPANTSGVQRAVRFWKYLSQSSYGIHVVCSSHAGEKQMENVVHVPNPSLRSLKTDTLASVATGLQRFMPYNEQLPWIPYAIAAGAEICQRVNVSAVISTSPPLATHLTALYLRRSFGLRWIADFRDPLVGNPFRSRSWAKSYDHLLEQIIFKQADAMVTVTDAIADDWCNRYPRLRNKINVIWNGFDPQDEFGPLPIPSRPYKVLSHVGSIYGLRNPSILLDSLNRLIRLKRIDGEKIRLRLVGALEQNSPVRNLRSFSTLARMGCLEYTGYVIPRKDAMRSTAESDYLIIVDSNQLSVGHAAPAKIFDYIRVGRPVLALTSRRSTVETILSRSGVRFSCIYNDDTENEVDNKLLAFMKFPTEPVRATDWFWREFDGKRQVLRLGSLIGLVTT